MSEVGAPLVESSVYTGGQASLTTPGGDTAPKASFGTAPLVVLITNVPNHYRIPLFNLLHDMLAAKGIRLYVLFGAAGYAARRSLVDLNQCKFGFGILRTNEAFRGKGENPVFTYSPLFATLKQLEPTVVVSNGFSFATTKLRLYNFLTRLPYIIWSGDVGQSRGVRWRVRALHRRWLVAKASGFIAYGTRAKKYLTTLGARASDIAIGINSVDTRFFADRAAEIRARKELAVAQPKRLVYVGYLTQRKNVMALLKCTAELASRRNDFVLDVVGDGDERHALESFARDHGLESAVKFHGFKQKSELPELIAGASGFLFQTDFDIWGLVLVEAMACGVPCIASPNAGATEDLVEEGVTGLVADFNDTQAAVSKINWLLENPLAARQMGERGLRLIEQRASLECSAAAFADKIEAVVGQSHKRRSVA